MNRRDFMKKSCLLSVAAVLPTFGEKEWQYEITRDFNYWWTFLARHTPTGVRYGWKVAEQHLVDRGMTPEEFMRFSISRVNPRYLESVKHV